MSLKTDFKSDILDTNVNTYRRYNVVNNSGTVINSNVHLVDITTYSQEGDAFGSGDINRINQEVNKCIQVVSFDSATGVLVTKSV